ncbi:hypothetical protein PHAVU_009G115400 [Phaseolus vulgaris]|uniref:Uncharacterized protein n=1 Tax=Phaseolus vulgaris TaxID=3885 RepID=V7AVG5_PHAVU|nr:hypothetical protein PHAVU_009G115400g [Phaseolus vulgaris]ESW09290.1 hypothetical protein PHAVU_009G115400g [Phaseolus vulgaris]
MIMLNHLSWCLLVKGVATELKEDKVIPIVLNALTIIGWDILKCFSLHGFHAMTTNVIKSKKVVPKFSYEEYHRLKSNSQAQSFTQSGLSTICISQTMEIQSSWILDSGALIVLW